jgi:glycerophosphoryl diester phosphodiesterase
MKRIVLGALLAACLLAPSTAAAQQRPLVVAHRGGALLMPENTFPAFDNALRLGVDMLEFDMVMTADDQLIISHDGSVNPSFCAADGVAPAPVRSLTLAQMQAFDCGSKHRAIYPTQQAVPGTKMPTPDAFFARYQYARTLFFGEIKMPKPEEGSVDPVAFARLVDAVVRKYGLEGRYILQSFDWQAIDAMHAINPRIRTCLLGVWRDKTDHLELARQHHASCMLLRLQDADAAEVKRLQAAGVQVFSDVTDDETGWRAYLARGDDAIFTNDPAGLTAFLATAAPR